MIDGDAGLDLSMGTAQVCIVDEKGGKLASMKVESAPDMMVHALRDVGGVERAVHRNWPHVAGNLSRLAYSRRSSIVGIDARQGHQSLKLELQV
ncbi:hypothetical protein [Aliihoeflea sp. 2WW]|uniref:hypothetical protein n=1 Tax=Aliihoeflea sp. 2WW TaxID=1381123 RepID=UPI0004B2D03E|nr:hypothetical protein [Aliihoeflea sp. 2WW]